MFLEWRGNRKNTFRFENTSLRFTIVEHIVLRIIYGVTEAPAIIYWNNPDTSTGIVSVQQNVAEAAPKGIYNIQGQKVAKMTGNGLYIVNGKKVINLAK